MAFTATFSIQQNTSGIAVITDTSDYSVETKASFSGRQIFLYRHDGTLANTITDFSFASYPSGVFTLQLTSDYSLLIVMTLIPISAVVNSTYAASFLKSFDYYANEYAVMLATYAANNSILKANPNYYSSLQKIYVNLKAATVAAGASQQKESQFALNEIKSLIDNHILSF